MMSNVTKLPIAERQLTEAQLKKLESDKAFFEELLNEFRLVNSQMQNLLEEAQHLKDLTQKIDS